MNDVKQLETDESTFCFVQQWVYYLPTVKLYNIKLEWMVADSLDCYKLRKMAIIRSFIPQYWIVYTETYKSCCRRRFETK